MVDSGFLRYKSCRIWLNRNIFCTKSYDKKW